MAPAAQFIDTPVVVPEFQSVEQAENYLAHFPILSGRGQIDSQTALGLFTPTKTGLIDSIYARQEYELKLQAKVEARLYRDFDYRHGRTRASATNGHHTINGHAR